MSASRTARVEREFNPSAAIFGWLWPGLGYIAIGQRTRGLLVMLGVLFLFLSGLLIGGLDCVDKRNDRWWFFAQSFCGPAAFAADYANQRLVQTVPMDYSAARGEADRRRFEQRDPELLGQLGRIGLGRVNDIGTLYIAMAGLMNLVVILDVLYYAPPPNPQAERRRGGSTP